MLWLQWATGGCGRPSKMNTQLKGDQGRLAKHPPMAKLVSHRNGVPTF